MDVDTEEEKVIVRFKSDSGEEQNGLFDIPLNIDVEQLTTLCNNLLKQEEFTPYLFYVEENEITKSLKETLEQNNVNREKVVEIIYQQQAIFKVRAITRCTSTIPGHAEAVLSVKFSPDGQNLASGSGDTTVRIWDIYTQTPAQECKGHKNWVLCIAWSPDSKRLVSGCKNGVIYHWNASDGKQKGSSMTGHKKWITDLVWEPFQSNIECRYFASSSKDGDIRIWDSSLCKCQRILTGHTKSISALQWGGEGLLYSASQDRTIRVWRVKDGVLCRVLEGHAHWVNTLALNTEYFLKTGPCILPMDKIDKNDIQAVHHLAKVKYESVCSKTGGELLASGSDDFTLYLWNPSTTKKPIARMTGHQQLINNVKFSPDGRLLASASYDKSIKLWDGKTGKFIATLRGHVQCVYMISWSTDSRLLVSGSADSTLKVWSMKTKKLEIDLPGHQDEVYAVDWSPDGERVASGGKDKALKLWHH